MHDTRPLTRTRRLLVVLLASSGLTLGIAACGDDDDSDEASTEEAAAPVDEVTLTATEYEFELSDTPTADTKTVSFQNDGEEPHVLIFAKINEGFTTEEAIKLEGEKGSAEIVGQSEAAPGATEAVQIKDTLGAGAYAMLCPLQTKDGEAHYDLGQLEEFDVE